jgi:hypothetical protein
MTSCEKVKFFGDAGVVKSVSYTYSRDYKYEVDVVHKSNYYGDYILHTNHLYQVGGTIYILGKNYR